MTDNTKYRIQLEGQYKALEEHLQKLTKEREKPIENQDLGLIAHWKITALVQCNCEAETLTRQGINREHEVEAVLPKLALFAEYQERQQELVES